MNVKSAPTATKVPVPRQNLFDLERAALHDLVELIQWRATTETESQAALANAISTSEKELARARKQISGGKERDLGTLTQAHQQTIQQIEDRYRNENAEADAELGETRKTRDHGM